MPGTKYVLGRRLFLASRCVTQTAYRQGSDNALWASSRARLVRLQWVGGAEETRARLQFEA